LDIQENQVKFLISVLFFVAPMIALAHGGGLDAS
jgi:hypothetical protein